MEAENASLKAENASLKAHIADLRRAFESDSERLNKSLIEENLAARARVLKLLIENDAEYRLNIRKVTESLDVCQDELKALKASLSGSASGKASTALLGGYEQKYLKYKNKYLSLKNSQ